jgi:type IV pilus assembly protein PilW
MVNDTMTIHARQQGLSLIELMISMGLGLLLIATIGFAYVGAKQSFRTQGALSRIQENARYAFEFMGLDIRMAGYTGGTTVYSKITAQPSAWTETTKDLREYPLIGYEAGSTPAWVSPIAGDALTVVRADNENERALDSGSTNCTGTTPCTLATWPTSAPAANDIYVAADYTRAAAFEVSAVDSSIKTVTSATDLGAFTGDMNARRLYPLSGVTYFIRNNPSGEPSLYRYRQSAGAAEELVEGIENMQITYGVDVTATADQSVDEYWTADEVNAGAGGALGLSMPAETSPAKIGYWRRVLSVRVTLSMVSHSGVAVGSNGGLLRKTLTNTIAVRNRL